MIEWLGRLFASLRFKGETGLSAQNRALQAEVAERRRAEEALHLNEESAHAFQERLKIFNELTLTLSRADTFDDLCQQAVELGREKLKFDRLGLWFLEDEHTVIGSFGTDEQGNTRDERGLRSWFDKQYLIKQTIANKQLLAYTTDIPLGNHRGEIVGRGWNVIAVLWDGDHVVGYLSVDNLLNQRPLIDSDLEILKLFGSTLGHLCRRKRAEQALQRSEESARAFQQRLKILYEVSLDLARVPTFDDLCRAAVELGRSKLGFDRLGIWLLDDDPNFLVGSFGTDEQGNTRDERGVRLSTSHQDKQSFQAMSEQASHLFVDQTPIYNEHLEVVGRGQRAMAMLSDGHTVIGTISTDNLLFHRPITDQDLEMLMLYGSTLGYLFSRKRAEEALLKERNLLRTIIDIIPDRVYVKDTSSHLLLVNKASWKNTPGVDSEEGMIGLTDSDLMSAELAEQIYASEREMFTTGKPILNLEEPARDYDGSSIYFLTTKVPLWDNQNKIIGLVGVSRDITDEKQAEQQRLELALQKERVDLLNEFIGNMSHDLKTPLSVIKTSLYLLEHLDDPNQQEAKIRIIKEQTLRLEKLIQDVITMSRLDHVTLPVFQPVDFNQVIRDVAAKLHAPAERKHLTVSLNLDAHLPLLMADENELWRLIANLYENAMHYTPEAGSVSIISRQRDDQVIAEVCDTGIGIGTADLPLVFDRFYRADPARSLERGGTGLGLAIVQRIVQLHQGQIEVESVEGQGSIFRVVFPTSHQPG